MVLENMLNYLHLRIFNNDSDSCFAGVDGIRSSLSVTAIEQIFEPRPNMASDSTTWKSLMGGKEYCGACETCTSSDPNSSGFRKCCDSENDKDSDDDWIEWRFSDDEVEERRKKIMRKNVRCTTSAYRLVNSTSDESIKSESSVNCTYDSRKRNCAKRKNAKKRAKSKNCKPMKGTRTPKLNSKFKSVMNLIKGVALNSIKYAKIKNEANVDEYSRINTCEKSGVKQETRNAKCESAAGRRSRSPKRSLACARNSVKLKRKMNCCDRSSQSPNPKRTRGACEQDIREDRRSEKPTSLIGMGKNILMRLAKVLIPTRFDGVERRGIKLYNILLEQTAGMNDELRPWWELKNFQKLPFIWASLTQNIPSESPFENFKRFWWGSKYDHYNNSEMENLYVECIWEKFTSELRLPFVMESYIAKLSAGKTNLFDNNELELMIKRLQLQ